jgi:hypothetical protein
VADTVIPFTERRTPEESNSEAPQEQDTQEAPIEDKVEDIVIPDEMPF